MEGATTVGRSWKEGLTLMPGAESGRAIVLDMPFRSRSKSNSKAATWAANLSSTGSPYPPRGGGFVQLVLLMSMSMSMSMGPSALVPAHEEKLAIVVFDGEVQPSKFSC